jgi:hypothetical protein
MRKPRELAAQPWRFIPGDLAYVRGWRQDLTGQVQIIGQIAGGALPHYEAIDNAGTTWRISQLELSSRPINL